MSSELLNSEAVKAQAHSLGFSACGLARPHDIPSEWAAYYERWLSEGRHAGMSYLQNHQDLRFHPSLLVPGVRTIVSVALNYHPAGGPTQPGLAWYAQGKDYHIVMRRLLRQLMETVGGRGRCFVDTAPVLEKYWAWQAGLGFIGRHTQLVIPRLGSAFFLGELFCTQEADTYDTPLTSLNPCGHCQRCIEACPTGAISNRGMDARRCLSYLTIESHDEEIPVWAAPHLAECFYGCDRCLRACPHLHAPSAEPCQEFRPSQELLDMTPQDWQRLTPEQYNTLFRESAVKRARYEGLKRNLKPSEGGNTSS